MAGISRELSVKYKGEDYTVFMNMGLINKIELSGINILALAVEIDKGGIPPASLLSTMLSIILQSAGCNATSEDVWVEIQNGDAQSVLTTATVLLNSMFPNVQDDKVKKSNHAKK